MARPGSYEEGRHGLHHRSGARPRVSQSGLEDDGGYWNWLSCGQSASLGSQNFGGPVQIIGHGGVSFDLGWNLVAGWRFHHMSDATIYGNDTKGVDFNFLELSYHF